MKNTRLAKPISLLPGTAQQEAIWEHILKSDRHLLIDARAGSGKTFTIVQAALRVAAMMRICVLAFNRHIVRELNGRLRQAGRYGRAQTLNGFGYAAVKAAYPNVQLMQDKLPTIVRRYAPGDRDLAGAVVRLVQLSKNNLFDGRDESILVDIALRHNIRLPELREEEVFRLVPLVLQDCLTHDSAVDFDDQIFWPIRRNLAVEQFDLVMVDEAQDLNPAQQELILRAAGKGRVVVVGDRHQSCYGFRGADPDAIPSLYERLRETDRGCDILPLTATRRCPKAHVRLVQGIVPDLEALPEAPEGEIREMEKDKAIALMKLKDLVICRVNRFLVPVAYALTRRGVKAVISGKDFGQGLLQLIESLRGSDIHDLLSRLQKYYDKERTKLLALGDRGSALIELLDDQVGCIEALCDGIEDIAALRNRIDRIFADYEDDGTPRDFVLLGTIHRTKGLEAPNVFVLAPELIPHPRAKQDWERVQEANLAYIAGTRSKFGDRDSGRLIFIGAVPKIYGGNVYPGRELMRVATGQPGPISLEPEAFVDEEEELWQDRTRL